MLTKPKIIFAGLAQNCAQYLPDVFKNIENISTLASETAFIFVENDSSDSTKQAITQWGSSKNNFKFISLDGLNQVKMRTIRLEFLRNMYLEVIKADENFRSFDVLVVLDMDDVSSFQIEMEKLTDAINLLQNQEDVAAVFPNQIGRYYDMWAFRHPKLCPQDVWQEVSEYVRLHHCSDQEAFDNTFAKKILVIDINSELIEVESAFGGLGLYKMKCVLTNPNPYLGSKIKILDTHPQINFCKTQICEHVHFHEGLRMAGKKLVIFPSLINGVNDRVHTNPSFYRSLPF